MKRSRMLWIIFAVFGVILLGSVALTGAMYFSQERNAQNSATSLIDAAGFNTTSLQNATDVLGVAVGFLDFEPGKGMDVELDFVPGKNLADPNTEGAITKPVCFTYWDTPNNFSTESTMPTIGVNIGLSGDVNWYPFDRYSGELWFYAFTGQKEGDCSNPLPILPTVFGSLQGFSVSTDYQPEAVNGVDFAYVSVKFTAKRTAVTIGFAVLLFIVMWCLTTSIVILTLWIWITGRRTELPIIVLSTALLYALPNIRNGQPGVPPRAGIIADLVGYIWHVLLVSICVISLIVNYIYRKDGKKPKKIDKESIVKMGVLNV